MRYLSDAQVFRLGQRARRRWPPPSCPFAARARPSRAADRQGRRPRRTVCRVDLVGRHVGEIRAIAPVDPDDAGAGGAQRRQQALQRRDGRAVGACSRRRGGRPNRGAQKSFCMSMISSAVRARSRVTLCGAVGNVSGSGGGSGADMSTCSREASQCTPRAGPSTPGAEGNASGFMTGPPGAGHGWWRTRRRRRPATRGRRRRGRRATRPAGSRRLRQRQADLRQPRQAGQRGQRQRAPGDSVDRVVGRSAWRRAPRFAGHTTQASPASSPVTRSTIRARCRSARAVSSVVTAKRARKPARDQ